MTSRIGPETRERIRTVWPDILTALADGQEVRRALAANLVTRGQIRAWLATEPEVRKEWDDAREASADAFMDEALATANSPTDDAAHARTKIDTLKWAARIRNPRLYSDKATLDVNVRTVDLTQIINAAQARLEASRVANAALLPAIEGVARRVLAGEQEASD